ncbi:DNA repair protein XRCC4 [Acorus gramineus]|uniref:DNA repair protein XRCC4 n=1 Tax=Acorus gramineus TaxID=55184 RepID=A0AAV9B5A7_ACOGR|nr:DNA repair protein XRCC4 [Acorus gramineus]
MDSVRHTCLRLQVGGETLFVKGTWFPSRFDLSITDGLHSWTCNASETEVSRRAEQWDQPVDEYIALAEQYLGFQQPGSTYGFHDAGDDQRRLSWTFEKQGVKLEWRWKCQPSSNSKQTTAGILDFLMDSNVQLSEEVVRKTQSYEKIKAEAEKCLVQSEKLSKEKAEFESAVYSKFVLVLNSKKAKLRELRDRLSKIESSGKALQEEDEDEFTDKTVSFNEGSDINEEEGDEESKEDIKNLPGTSKSVVAARSKGPKRKSRR